MIYVSSDWHGVPIDKIDRLLNQVSFSSDDYLYVLGDVIDRGDYGVDLIKKIMNEPNIRLIRGNHEQMLLSCSFLFDEAYEDSVNDFDYKKLSLLRGWRSNGADPTITGLSIQSFAMRRKILRYLEETPLYENVIVGDREFFLVHAGLGVDYDEESFEPAECSEYDLLWTRPRLTTRYSKKYTTVFGHTPTCFFGKHYDGRILKTETWINVDVGSAMGFMPALLRLDDLKEFYIY